VIPVLPVFARGLGVDEGWPDDILMDLPEGLLFEVERVEEGVGRAVVTGAPIPINSSQLLRFNRA
jgi:hypothetical protein